MCQDENNSDLVTGLNKLCDVDGTPGLPPNGDDAVLVSISHVRANDCNTIPYFFQCPRPGIIELRDNTDGNRLIALYEPTGSATVSFYICVPIGHKITVKGDFPPDNDPRFYQDIINIVNIQNSCNGSGYPVASCSLQCLLVVRL